MLKLESKLCFRLSSIHIKGCPSDPDGPQKAVQFAGIQSAWNQHPTALWGLLWDPAAGPGSPLAPCGTWAAFEEGVLPIEPKFDTLFGYCGGAQIHVPYRDRATKQRNSCSAWEIFQIPTKRVDRLRPDGQGTFGDHGCNCTRQWTFERDRSCGGRGRSCGN